MHISSAVFCAAPLYKRNVIGCSIRRAASALRCRRVGSLMRGEDCAVTLSGGASSPVELTVSESGTDVAGTVEAEFRHAFSELQGASVTGFAIPKS